MRYHHNGPRARIFFVWAGLRWVLLMFLITPVVQAPALAKHYEPPKPLLTWTGRASWYGAQFNGKETAFGETYDMNAMTAAHAYLPDGSIIRVTALRTGISRVVRVNDRGPYFPGRELDLSFRAASQLGIIESGVARVRIELLEVPHRHWTPRQNGE
ncbi:MAG TPA: septal ring lytic transglycosylase RlpA family protein [Candidatus Acidoferrales bacterium]|nr:septal ring lytic transglycosylase RlpA family protein [Candidatus Acidoferrales bacterium]